MVQALIADMSRSLGASGWPALKRVAGPLARAVPIPRPVLLVGCGSSLRLAEAVAAFGHARVMLVTDPTIARLGLAGPFLAALERGGADVVVFDGVTPDAPVPVVEAGVKVFEESRCEALVAFGGGSVIDAAKVIGLAAANGRPPRALAGWFRAWHGPAPLYAVPTTAGTGSEVTVAAVIADPQAGCKFAVIDTRLVPAMAALDPMLMTGLPPPLTAATGIDALTHAVEAFIGGWATPETDRLALAAVHLIWQHLPRAVADGRSLADREQMALASCYAGQAFTRASVGNVHALAHALGARCHVPHGQANALLLPGVLRFSRDAAVHRMARLARQVGLRGTRERELAGAFCEAVQSLIDGLSLPRRCESLQAEDIPALAQAACREADLNYPVPRRMAPADAQALLQELLPEAPKPPGPARTARARRSARQASPSTQSSRSAR